MKKISEFYIKNVFLGAGVWSHSEAQNIDILSFWVLVKWPLRRKFELILRAKRQFGPRWIQIPEGDICRYFLTGFLYLQSLFYFKLTRNALFTPFSSHNASQMVIFCPKFAQQIRFWWVLGKIKPRNNEKTQKMRRKAFLWGVYSGAQNRSKWRNAVSRSSEHKHLWNRPGCYKESQNGSRPPNITFFKIFWRAFLISGLYFASKQAEMHFLGHFSLKLLSGRYEANSCWNFAPTPILSFKMTQTPNKCLPEHMLTCFLHFWASIYPTPIHFLNHFLVNLVYQNANIVILQLDKIFCLGFL